jgi:hypothetical protein
MLLYRWIWCLWLSLVGLLGVAFAFKKLKANQKGGNHKLLFQERLLLGSIILKAP